MFCNGIYSYWGSHATDSWDDSLILVNKSVYTAFAVKPSMFGDATSVWRVYAVIVQQAVSRHTSLRPSTNRCARAGEGGEDPSRSPASGSSTARVFRGAP